MILGLNYGPEKIGIAVYTTGMAEFLAQKEHEVDVVAGNPYYPEWHLAKGYKGWNSRLEDGVRVIRCPHYVPSIPTGTKRIIHHLTFAASALLPTVWTALRRRPAVVIVVVPSLISAPLGRLAAKISGAKSWLHVQDFEVDAASATGLISTGWLSRLGLALEGIVLRSFDVVSTISPQMCNRLATKGVEASRILEFRNWTDVDTIRPTSTPSPYRSEWQISTEHVALYSGNISRKQGIHVVVEAAKLLRHRRDLTFVVCGNGPYRAQLEASGADLTNIQFRDLQPAERLAELLTLGTLHLLPQIEGAADLVFPSKLANMLASGRPIIATVQPDTDLAHELDGCGIIVPPGNSKELAHAIEELLDSPETIIALSRNSRTRATSRWSKKTVLQSLIDRLP